MSNHIKISGSSLFLIKNKPLASLETVYGIGRLRSKKIRDFLLTNPNRKEFKVNLVESSQELKTQRIFKAIKADNQLKFLVYSNLEKLARIGSYKAHRMLQNLPSKGQRTHTNGGTPKRLNPFVILGVKSGLTQELILENKKWELNWNARSNDLAEITMKVDRKKYSKAASLAKKKMKEKKKEMKEKKKEMKEKKNKQ